MKKKISSDIEDELRPEYDLTKLLKGGVRGKYVERYRAGTNVVLLAPDVAQAFPIFYNDTATTEIYTLSLHDALPISGDGLAIFVRELIGPIWTKTLLLQNRER